MNIAIITGASSGLGKEFARQLDRKCVDNIDEFWLIARRKERLEELEDTINRKCRIFAYDISDATDMAKLSHALKTADAKVRILVNCAGFGLVGRFTELNIDKQLDMVDVNCKATVKLTYMCLPYMKKNSRIINVASAAAFAPQPLFTVYAATKAFVESFNRALNSELKNRKIYITSVCPGPVNTEFFDVADVKGEYNKMKKFFMADPAKVVSTALRDSINKKSISVYGTAMKTWRYASRLVPTDLLMKIYG